MIGDRILNSPFKLFHFFCEIQGEYTFASRVSLWWLYIMHLVNLLEISTNKIIYSSFFIYSIYLSVTGFLRLFFQSINLVFIWNWEGFILC